MGIDAIDAIDTIEEGIEGDFLNRGSVSCQNNRPSEALFLASAGSKLRFRLRLSLAWSCPRYAISDGGFAPRLRGGWQRGGGGSEGGASLGLFGEEVVGEGGDVGYIDGAVGVDVGDCYAVGF